MGKTTVRDTGAKGGLRLADTEIDLLCINENTKEYLVGECKFKGVPFKYSDYLNTMAKLTPFKESGSFWYVLFSESGFDEKILDEEKKSEHVRLYPMEEVVNFKR